MAKSKQTFNKKDLEKKRLKKRQDKQEKMDARKANPKETSLESMMAYVDENGNITNVPPDPRKRKEVDADTIELGVPKREPADAVRTGKVKFFNTDKGFGFIGEENGRDEYFVHVNGLLETIQENDVVTFELERGAKGMTAVRVKKR